MYDYQPPHRNATAKILLLGLCAAFALAMIGSALVPAYPALLQIVAVILLVPVIRVAVRYLVSRYLYRLRAEDGRTDFEVYLYRGGARMQLVCRVALSEITAAAPLTEQNKKPPRGVRRYNYAPDLYPADAWVLSVTNEDGDCEILLSPDEYLIKVFTGER